MVLLSAAGFVPPLWASIPFVVMLLMIAIGPLVVEHWWEKNSNKLIVSLLLGIPVAIYLLTVGGEHGVEMLLHTVLGDYIPFIVLLMALFVITGGIHLKGDIQAKPIVNTIFLAIGFVLASFMGTTGAAMLLIRPLLATNSQRKYTVHTVLFFIGAVANCGGMLTPLGDPPLLLLYLRGASFTWFFNLVPEWAFAGACLLLVYFLVDTYFYKKEDATALQADKAEKQPIRIAGGINLVYLLLVVASVAFINDQYLSVMKHDHELFNYFRFLREIILVALIFLSLYTTKKDVRSANKFSWGPIVEVAVLFIGIFTTMTPTMAYLNANASQLGLTEPWQFFYSAGALSSFLDNAPTAVAFYNVALGNVASGLGVAEVAGIPEVMLKAISMGAVFFGAMTYIGNGPNFMVKAIAEEGGVKMPSFFGYMFKFSLIVLLPIYILVQLIFL